jgi:ABC-type cobalt transport system substrate-binding protein
MYSFPTALTSVPFSIAQAVGSGIIFVLMGKALEKAKIERLIGR